MSIASMSPETTMIPSSELQLPSQPMTGNDRALSDVSSTSSSPTLPSTMGVATRQQQQTYMLPKNRRHTMAGIPSIHSNATATATANTTTPMMQMSNQVSSAWSHTQPQQLVGANQMPYMVDHASLFNSSAAIADPARFASLMMQSGINMPIYNHHQQPLPHVQQQQQHSYQTPSFMNNNGNPHPYVPPRKSRLSHPMSYSQEDLRSLRRAHMNKPINTGNFPPAHARSSPLPPDFVYPGASPSFSDVPTTPPSPSDGYPMMNKMYHHHQQPRMTRQLRRQSSMTAMMPSYYAQRHQQQHYLPPRNRHTQPPPPPPQQPLPQQQPPTSIQPSPFSSMATAMGQQQQQQHHRRHTISIPGEPPIATQQSSMQQQAQYQEQLPYIPYNDNSQASDNTMMSVDGTTPDYASVSFSPSDMSTPMDTTSTMMMLDPPSSGATGTDAAMMSELMIGSEQWPMMAAAAAAAAGGNLEDLQQRTEGHVM
ncbi:hypothetical protein K492DRAFT_22650 [Lichtheimia hyalospora FSU 10163]|nr:hypothetical protein K492DRAFT_22650 [Lichtheimia hyalospora FSU 10163]